MSNAANDLAQTIWLRWQEAAGPDVALALRRRVEAGEPFGKGDPQAQAFRGELGDWGRSWAVAAGWAAKTAGRPNEA